MNMRTYIGKKIITSDGSTTKVVAVAPATGGQWAVRLHDKDGASPRHVLMTQSALHWARTRFLEQQIKNMHAEMNSVSTQPKE